MDSEQLLAALCEFCFVLRGNFILKAKFSMGERYSMVRELLVLLLNGLVSVKNGVVTSTPQGFMLASPVVNRAELALLVRNPTELSKVFEIDDIVEWKQEKWQCGYDDDAEFLNSQKVFVEGYVKGLQGFVAEIC